MTDKVKEFIVRFTPSQRLEHMILLLSFTGLAITGLPQKYAETEIGLRAIEALGGIESIRIAHRIFAVALLTESIYHGGILSYKFFVLRQRMSMLPTLRDVNDVFQWTFYNLGLRKEHPKLPRYSFIEKAEYLAVVWGTVIMALTGFMLWNPLAASKIFPASFIPAALAAHSAEALLAVLSILLWHMYNVIIKAINRSMFTGKISREMMEEEHGAELDEIDSGHAHPMPSPESIRKRRSIFIPYATIMTIILVGLLIRFVTVETTAIETVPRVVAAPDAELTASAADGVVEDGALLWQDLQCSECHGSDAGGAEGALNKALANTPLEFEQFVERVRTGPADMRAYASSEISDQQLADLYTWLQSLESSE